MKNGYRTNTESTYKKVGRGFSFIDAYLYFVLPCVIFYFMSFGNKEWVASTHAYFGSRYVLSTIVAVCYSVLIILVNKPWRNKQCPLDRW